MHIKVSHESPLSLLSESLTYNDYQYCLVHLLDQHSAYANHFKYCSHCNVEWLLDNSIFELGTAFESDKFAKKVEEYKPNFYVVPDVLNNALGTITSYNTFVSKYGNLPGLKIGVVQGETYNELVECYKFMNEKADYIAISFDYKFYNQIGTGDATLNKYCTGRPRFIQMLINDGIWNWNKPVHLLGCSLAKEFRFYVQKNIYNIRSIDTSNPIVAGIHGLYYNSDFGLEEKPSVKLADLITTVVNEDQKDAIVYNIKKFKEIIGR